MQVGALSTDAPCRLIDSGLTNERRGEASMEDRPVRRGAIIDRSGRKVLPIGRDGFASAAKGCVLVDKTMLIADVLDSGYAATLFCRPRRFGKTLNMTMLKAFLELADDSDVPADLFEGTRIWGAAGGAYQREFQRYPVVYVSMRTAKGSTWPEVYGALKNVIAAEYARHGYLAKSERLTTDDRSYVARIASGEGSGDDYADSLIRLTRMLKAHHGRDVVVLVDEYDAPVMAIYSSEAQGAYDDVVAFLKRWLTGALKDGGEALAFACLTGVQRISKESIFSDLNNLVVNTPLSREFDEYFGFTEGEVAELASYLGHSDCLDEARTWYDGYRFGEREVYNPWSVLNYLRQGCIPGTYWNNTSSNAVISSLISSADDDTFSQLCGLLEPGGEVAAPLDLGTVFPDVGVRHDAVWSMLYLAGYLTTDLTYMPDDYTRVRPLRVPNCEVARIYRSEIIARFGLLAGGVDKLVRFRRALMSGDERALGEDLARIAAGSVSSFDLVSESACHMLLLGLCFGLPGYGDPRSNREAGYGRYDIQVEPIEVRPGGPDAYGAPASRPRITIEMKYLAGRSSWGDSDAAELSRLSRAALVQIEEKGYDSEPLGKAAEGRLRWGIAFCGKRVAVTCERA